ncbi:MAG TPA: glycosyltransferase family 2 protein [Gemmatales bacterium]|nr:glycosyltransferase family 2 protein [Gemmatales bacterium]
MGSTVPVNMDVDEIIHQLNQRYRSEFDRAEALKAELNDIQHSRWWPWFLRMRRLSSWVRGVTPASVSQAPTSIPVTSFIPQAQQAWSANDVSIIIPFRDQWELLDRCISSLQRTASRAELILVDNGSTENKTKNLMHRCQVNYKAQVVHQDEPFNFSRLCNAGAAVAHRPLLLFLNNDVMATQPAWLDALLEVAADDRVGITGATLLYPDRTIQHAGLEPTGPGESWIHPYRYEGESHPGKDGELRRIRTVPAVTGACLLIRRKLFEKLHGFDPQYAVTMNDVDLCQRVKALGKEVVITPFARLVHFESLSRGYQREAA